MAELRLITVNEITNRTTKLAMSVVEETPHASPIMSEPKFGRMNSAREIVPTNFTVSNMTLKISLENGNKKEMPQSRFEGWFGLVPVFSEQYAEVRALRCQTCADAWKRGRKWAEWPGLWKR